MPIYVYDCKNCQLEFEEMQPITAAPLQPCPQCGALARRVLQPVGIIFKGSGWYKTDSRTGSASTGNGSSEKAEKKAEGAGNEATKGSPKEGSAKEANSKESSAKESNKSEGSSPSGTTSKAS